MSYTLSVKKFLCKKNCEPCCKKTELYGFLLFSAKFVKSGASFSTENEFIIKRYEDIFKSIDLKTYRKTEKQLQNKRYKIEIDADGVAELTEKFRGMSFNSPLRIDFSILEKECCPASFLRGVFLASGFIYAPNSSYHLEIKTPHIVLAESLVKFCDEYDIKLKSTLRNGVKVLYIKSSEQIKDFLAMIGASKFVFDIANAELERNLKNNVNRAVNCEQANIEKSVAAAQNQIKAIKKLKENNYKHVPKELITLAELRLENPEMTLEELGKTISTPLSKSGTAHRMKKIQEMSKIEFGDFDG